MTRLYVENNDVSEKKIVAVKIFSELIFKFSILSQFLHFASSFAEKFDFYETTPEDFINLSGIAEISKFVDIDELRIHYKVDYNSLEVYQNHMSRVYNKNIKVFEVTDDGEFLSEKRDFYCPLTYISPNKSEILYKYIGVDFCNLSTTKNLLNSLRNSSGVIFEKRNIIRNRAVIFDFAKKTNSGFTIVSILIEDFIKKIKQSLIVEFEIDIFKNNEKLYSTSSNSKDFKSFSRTFSPYKNDSENDTSDYNITFLVSLKTSYSYTFLAYLFPIFIILYISVVFVSLYKHSTDNLRLKLDRYEFSNKLLGYINHELRNPLNSVQGLVVLSIEDIKELDISEESESLLNCIKSNLHTAEKGCAMINHIVNDILDMTRLQDGKVTIKNENVVLKGLFYDIKKILSQKSQESPSVDLTFESNIEEICIDKYRLTQILLNFITNSYKFTNSGFIKVKVASTNGVLRISVSDSGIGIPLDQQNMLFSPYKQINYSDSLRHGGVGLGLFICKMLSELMGFDIGVVSSCNPGSEFYIEKQL